MYGNGEGVARDYLKAVTWYRRAAEQGIAQAQSNLGLMFEVGRGVSRDYKQAVHWYRKAAEQGNAAGQYALGTMYREGRGVQKDSQSAYFWLLLASAAGNALAPKVRDEVASTLEAQQRLDVHASVSKWKPGGSNPSKGPS